MTAVTADGSASVATWLVGSVIVVACIRSASIRSSVGEIARSQRATMNQVLFALHAGFAMVSIRASRIATPLLGWCAVVERTEGALAARSNGGCLSVRP